MKTRKKHSRQFSSRIALSSLSALAIVSMPLAVHAKEEVISGDARVHLKADASETSAALGLDVEINPAFLAIDGYFFKVGGSPKGSNWSYSAVVLKAEMSRGMADLLNSRNKGRGFGDEELRHGSVGIDIGRFWGDSHDGVHASVALNLFRLRVERGEEEGKLVTISPAVRIGYRWFPTNRRVFFIEPAMALGTQLRVAGDKDVGGIPYRSYGLIKAAGFHLGLRI